MASAATTAPVVTSAGVQVTVHLGGTVREGEEGPSKDGRTYILAAPTLAEVGSFLEAQALAAAPTRDDLNEAIRTALREVSAEGEAALDAYDEAEDGWVSFTAIHVITGPDATEAMQAEAVGLHKALLKARRARDRAVVTVSKVPAVLAIKAEQQAAQWRESCALVALLLRDWKGVGLADFPEGLDGAGVEAALPMGDVGALAQRARELMQPTVEAGKA